jgi:hypothetical protein
MGLEKISLDQYLDSVPIQDVSTRLRWRLSLSIWAVIFMRWLHCLSDWAQYGTPDWSSVSGYRFDGLWVHGSGDHATRPTPACAPRKG